VASDILGSWERYGEIVAGKIAAMSGGKRFLLAVLRFQFQKLDPGRAFAAAKHRI